MRRLETVMVWAFLALCWCALVVGLIRAWDHEMAHDYPRPDIDSRIHALGGTR